jgi:hypothetical protein
MPYTCAFPASGLLLGVSGGTFTSHPGQASATLQLGGAEDALSWGVQ